MKLTQTHVKSPILKKASILLIGKCVQNIFPKIYKQFTKEKIVLTCCPEAENVALIMNKTATILTCSHPREVTVLTIDGSPYCFTLHAAVNQALFVTKEKTPTHHFVIAEGKALEVDAASIRVSRYLHLVQQCIQKHPKILEELSRHSLEQQSSKKQNKDQPLTVLSTHCRKGIKD